MLESMEVLRQQLLERIDLSREATDTEVYYYIDEIIIEQSKVCYISYLEKGRIRQELFNSVRKLDVLQELLEDSTITEIMVNGTADIFIEQNGKISRIDRSFSTKEKLEDVIQQIVARCNRTVNAANPIVDARLESGDRVHIILEPVALNGPIITIRRFPDRPIDMEQLMHWGSITSEAAAFLRQLVVAGYNIFISGGTGSGKTTFLNGLSNYIPREERIITIEDNAELQIQGIDNLVRLEVRNANVEGCKEITIRDLIKAALRMRPNRIVVGEVRSAEAIDMLQAMNTGHDGSLSTGHGNSPRDMLSRLEAMVLMGMDLPVSAIRRQIASAINIIVHLGRMRDRSRKVLEIIEIMEYRDGEIQTHPLYKFKELGTDDNGKVLGSLEKAEELFHLEKLKNAGIS